MTEWTRIDKTAWGPGPWQDEPDKIHWIDPTTDLDCLMVRNEHGGNWCGYVAVTEAHPWFGVGYDDTYALLPLDADGDQTYLDVHGGLTYSGLCMETDDESRLVCHVPQPGRPDRVWWFGFDCAHSHDVRPGQVARDLERGWDPLLFGDERYRDRRYVESEVRRLARHLRSVA